MTSYTQQSHTRFDVIGAPLHHGQRKSGVKNGPDRMREAGLIKRLFEIAGVRVADKGNIVFDEYLSDPSYENIKNPRSVFAANRKVSRSVGESVKRGRFCLTLGGDHSLAIGSIHGHASVEPDLGVIWVDAHGDINPPAASASGNVHGMPLAFLVHELRHTIPQGLPEADWLNSCISIKNIAYIGLRDVDEPEKRIFEQFNVAAFFMDDVRKLGIATVVCKAIDAVSPGLCRPIHLSYDIDALDSTVAPSTGTCVPGGLSLSEGIYITRAVAATGRLTAMDLVEVNPELGSDEDQSVTLAAACDVVSALFGPAGIGSRKLLAPGGSRH